LPSPKPVSKFSLYPIKFREQGTGDREWENGEIEKCQLIPQNPKTLKPHLPTDIVISDKSDTL